MNERETLEHIAAVGDNANPAHLAKLARDVLEHPTQDALILAADVLAAELMRDLEPYSLVSHALLHYAKIRFGTSDDAEAVRLLRDLK